MDKLMESITQKCLRENLIDEGQTEWLLYSLQCRVMNIGGFCILIASGLLVAPLPQVLVLNLGLAFLRKRTNGLHMPTKLSCCAVSLLCEYVCLYALRLLSPDRLFFSFALLIVSTTLILWLAPCNNKAIHLSRDELIEIRKGAHIRLAAYLLVVLILFVQMPLLANTLVVAETAVALLVVLARLGVGIQ
ncbi:accessory gene regulator B family protein [Gemmiger sp.]|uniref:accessory gene regulator B family protein n=1 Tax=Gemmiger sp. TaxID=2049027 RepID=UPI003F0E9717